MGLPPISPSWQRYPCMLSTSPISCVTNWLRRHIDQLEVEAIIAYSVILFVKLSALLLYIRLFSVNRLLHWLIWAGINIQVIAWAAFIGHIIGLHVVCKDFENSTEKAVCLNVSKAICVQAFFNFLTDCYVLLLPITVVLKMQMSVQRKIGMVLIFMTGLLFVLLRARPRESVTKNKIGPAREVLLVP